MVDQYQRNARVAQTPHDLQQLVDLGGGERRRGLVEEQQLRRAAERLQDLEALARADREALHRFVGIARVEAEAGGRLARGRGELRAIRKGGKPARDPEILGHREARNVGIVLVDDADPGGAGVARAAEAHGAPLPLDRPRVGLERAAEDSHQCGFPGAVLADDPNDLPAPDPQRNAREGGGAVVGLGETRRAEEGRRTHGAE